MIFHKKYRTLFYSKKGKVLQYLSPAAVGIGALRVNDLLFSLSFSLTI